MFTRVIRWTLQGYARFRRRRYYRQLTRILCCLLLSSVASAESIPVELHAPAWCVPCQQMDPVVRKVQRDFAIQRIDLDGDKESLKLPKEVISGSGRAFNNAWKVETIPAYLAIDSDSKQVIGKHEGTMTEKELRNFYINCRVKTKRANK